MNDTIPLAHPHAYRVPSFRLIAGEYPFTPEPEAARARFRGWLDAGVTRFVDLTEEGELLPYAPLLAAECAARGLSIEHRRLPIRDVDIPTRERMREILDHLDETMAAGHTAYLHCWGGVGRTGTVVGCLLVRHGMSGEEALAEVQRLFDGLPPGKRGRHPRSPETGAQRRFVREWSEP